MIFVRIDVSEERPLPEIAPIERDARGHILPETKRGTEEDALQVMLATTHFGPPREPVLSIEARVPDLYAAGEIAQAIGQVLDNLTDRRTVHTEVTE